MRGLLRASSCWVTAERYCYPLTVTDYRSRYLLGREGLQFDLSPSPLPLPFSKDPVQADFGPPSPRPSDYTDNGTPFCRPVVPCSACPGSRCGGCDSASKSPTHQTRSSTWHNGRRADAWHADAGIETGMDHPARRCSTSCNSTQRFDDFIGVYNNQRPHLEIAMPLGGAYPTGTCIHLSPRVQLRAARRPHEYPVS